MVTQHMQPHDHGGYYTEIHDIVGLLKGTLEIKVS